MRCPEELLMDVYWSFHEDQYTNQDEFNAAFLEYSEALDDEVTDLNAVCFEYPKLVLVYDSFEDDFEDEDMDGDDFVSNTVLIEAENGKSFTTAQLLYKIHKTVGVLVEDEDAHFFEGLNFITDEDEDYPGLPVYYLNLGS